MKMLQQLFVPVLFLVAVLGEPTEKECELEEQHAMSCASEANINWNNADFEKEVPKFEKWVKCVGEPVCPLNAKLFERTKLQFNMYRIITGELSPCYKKSNINSCRPIRECEDLSFHVCATDIMKQSNACSLKDVNTYISTIPDLVRYCNVKKEIRELRGIPPSRIYEERGNNTKISP